MSFFRYQARNAEGKLIIGRLESSSDTLAANQLMDQNITPITIQEVASDQSWSEKMKLFHFGKPVKIPELVMFARQMYAITRAGVPLIEGILGIADSTTARSVIFKMALETIAEDLRSGSSLSVAMSNHPKIFNELFITLIKVGEESGQLEHSFLQISQYLDRDLNTLKNIKSATRYPSYVLLTLIAAMVILNLFVIPKLSELFTYFGNDIPLPTQILLTTSTFFIHYWPHLLITTLLCLIGIYFYINTNQGSIQWGWLKLKVPIIGKIIRQASLARYARSFATMQNSGVALSQIFILESKIIHNPFLTNKILTMKDHIEHGESISKAHLASDSFPTLVLQMISIGEHSGTLGELFNEVAEYYEKEVDYDLQSLNDKIGPLLVITMAAMVLILALGIFLPIWDLYSTKHF